MNKGHWSYGRSSYALDIKLHLQSLKEYLFSARKYRRYWNDRGTLTGPRQSFSHWLTVKKIRSRRLKI
jgi:hypothetical protein